jgi:putative ABC transport system substrate-binding protein
MRRRDFIALVGGAALALPCPAQTQPRLRRIGMLLQFQQSPEVQTWVNAFNKGLEQQGWREGTNIKSEVHWAGSDLNVVLQHAKELVASKPEVIFSSSSPTTAILIKQTRSIPIVFGNLVDPIGQGFVTSLAKPGGNVTGFVNLEDSVTGKLLELLKEIAPRLTKVAMFYNPATAPYHDIYIPPFKTAAANHGIEPVVTPYRNLAELDAIMAKLAKDPNVGQIAMPDGFASANHEKLVEMANRYRLPTIFAIRASTAAGGLIAYGNDISDNYRRAAGYVSRILKGESPNNLPVQFPVKFYLLINLKTAKALGLDVPLFLQQQADEVIE